MELFKNIFKFFHIDHKTEAEKMIFSRKALDLILRWEGFDQPGIWPGYGSGITIGYGYDLGYEPFQKDWNGRLKDEDFTLLLKTVGLRGTNACNAARNLKHIKIPVEAAKEVFYNVTLPKYIKQTKSAFPNSEKLPDDAFGALVSIVFNRGSSLDGSRRSEMKNIREILSKGIINKEILEKIADQVDSMKRLWPDNIKSSHDLYDRRIAEANLIRNSVIS